MNGTTNGTTGTTPGDIMYSIPTDSDSGPFTVDPANGDILTMEDLDYDSNTSLTLYSFEVACTSPSSGSMTAASMQITINSVNEFPPTVEIEDYGNNTTLLSTVINETSPIGTIVASATGLPGEHVKFTFSDLDRGPDGALTYLQGTGDVTTRELFDVDPLTGTVTLQIEIDVDSLSTAPVFLSLIVSGCDRAGLMGEYQCPSVQFFVIVEPVNNHHPRFTEEEYQTFNSTYQEGDYLYVHIASTPCVDGDMHAVGVLAGIEPWNSTDDVQELITIDNSGNVCINGTLDYEQHQILNLTLRCTDTDGLEDFSTLSIMVTAVNDNNPQFQRTNYSFSVNRIELPGDLSIGQVQAVDEDVGYGGTLTYSMESHSNFDIDGEDGTVTLTDHLLAIEIGSSVELTVQASDGEFTDTAQVTISVNGPLSVLDIIVLEAGFVSLLLICTLVCCCFCYFRRRRVKK